MEHELKKILDTALRELETKDPQIAKAAKEAATHAETVTREAVEERKERIRSALKKAADAKNIDSRLLVALQAGWGGLGAACSGTDCSIGCASGCIVGCAVGGGALVGFGAAAGTIGGAGTSKVLSVTEIFY